MSATVCALFLSAFVYSAPSGPKKEKDPKPEIVAYNEGVDLLMIKDFAAAATKFNEALSKDDQFAEAHNNLAFALRKQGSENYAMALEHYNRAVELKPKMAEAYMYRGVLQVALGDPDAAKADLAELERLKSTLAPELAAVIQSGSEKEPEQFFGVTKKLR